MVFSGSWHYTLHQDGVDRYSVIIERELLLLGHTLLVLSPTLNAVVEISIDELSRSIGLDLFPILKLQALEWHSHLFLLHAVYLRRKEFTIAIFLCSLMVFHRELTLVTWKSSWSWKGDLLELLGSISFFLEELVDVYKAVPKLSLYYRTV